MACCLSQQALVTSYLVVSTSMIMKVPNFENKGFYWFLRSSAAADISRMNRDETAGDKLTVCEQELL